MQLDLAVTVLLNLGGMLVGTTALIVGIRGKLEALKTTIEMELQHINQTLKDAVQEIALHEADIRDLQWHTGFKGSNGVDTRLKKGS